MGKIQKIAKKMPNAWNRSDHSDEYFFIFDALNSGVPLTTRQPTEFMWLSGDPIPHCCVPFIGIHVLKKNQEEPPFYGELYPTYNLNNSIIITNSRSQHK